MPNLVRRSSVDPQPGRRGQYRPPSHSRAAAADAPPSTGLSLLAPFVSLLATLVLLLLLSARVTLAQGGDRALNIGANKTGLSIGDSREWTGVRLNFRDTRLRKVRGINATIWSPKEGGEGDISGIAIGLPLTGGRNVRGIQVGAGFGATEKLSGIGVGVLGMGSGSGISGIMVGGLGAGTGGDLSGIIIGGAGAGAGGDASGFIAGGLGAGVAGDVHGIVFGGLGAGAGGEIRGIGIGGLGIGAAEGVRGIAIGGLGVGSGGALSGIMIGGLGVGTGEGGRGVVIGGLGAGMGNDFAGIGIGGLGVAGGGNMTGIFFGGAGVGAGGSLRYLSIAGLGVGAPDVRGVAIGGLGVGGETLHGLMVAGATVRVVNDGMLHGAAVSPVNFVQGTTRGLAIAVVNYTRKLHGVQLGVINIARDNPSGRKVLPIINWGSR